jgi:predicted NAD/FAD-dependent oxidoreductase
MAGIAAARQLKDRDWEPVLFDKGRRPGGRLATRRLSSAEGDEATLDSGAQYFTVREASFANSLHSLMASGVVREWHQGFGSDLDHPRYCGAKGMNSVAQAWGCGLTIHTDTRVGKIEQVGSGWRVMGEDFDAVILTAPVPQSLELMRQPDHAVLGEIAYDRCLAVLAIPVKPVPILGPGSWKSFDDEPISFVADNRQKGISTAPAITIHASAGYSLEHWDDEGATAELLRAAGVEAHATYLHRWKFARATVIHPERCYREPGGPPLVYAGDGFAAPRIEGAVLSGWAAADAVSEK